MTIMATNFAAHSRMVRGISLTAGERVYVGWVGPIVPFATILILMVIIFFLHESKERRQDRKMGMITKIKALAHKEQYLDSPEMDEKLKALNPLIDAEVMRQLGVGEPTTSTALTQRRMGFGPDATIIGPTATATGEPEPKN